MFRKRSIEEMSVEELEKALLFKRRQSRLERFQNLSRQGYSTNEALMGVEAKLPSPADTPPSITSPAVPPTKARVEPRPGQGRPAPKEKSRSKKIMDMALLSLEIVSLV